MKFGIMFANTGPYTTPEGARALGQAAEDAGIESLWAVEHVVVPKGYASQYPYDPSGRMPGPEDSPIPDPLVWLTYMAAVTTTVKLATGILILPQRNPLVLAKECATLDQLSGGRLLLGVGAGWLEEEFDALGVPFASRGQRLDDHIGALRAAWGEQPASYSGPVTQFDDLYIRPQPVDGTVPIVVGGHSAVAARRAGRLGDGFFPGRGADDELATLMATMRSAAVDAGRDPAAIEITTGGAAAFAPDPVGALQRQEALGVSRVVIPPLTYNPTEIGPVLADFADRVISKVS
ncbi:MAG TPA: LLM class F420-dependent oxidoreductase [Acidimicrobiales bacterium]|nr:LLM class F420-dependent oxidoreductase [Acidimicrobiales bacterium]